MLTKKTMLFISITVTMMNHPMAMGTMLIVQTILLCTMITQTFLSSWYSYILFISIVSGLMVLFIYMASITSNEKFNIKPSMMLLILMSLLIMILLNLTDNSMETINKILNLKLTLNKNENLKTTIKFFNLYKSVITIILMLTLFILLVSISNISTKMEGPLKKTYV